MKNRKDCSEPDESLRETFERFDKEYFGGRLCGSGWTVTSEGDFAGFHGQTIDGKRQTFVRVYAQRIADELQATLIHEMAHAILPVEVGHGERWVAEMKRLKAAGAPTEN